MKPHCKPHCKPLANHLQTTWHKAAMPIVLMASLFAGMASASVPLAWQVTPHHTAPVTVYRLHGETLDFHCTLSGFGELPFAQGADIRLWYQTNGMGSAWWSLPATVSSNVISATFPPQANPGADHLALFFGAPSNVYASAVLHLRPSPGCTPNVLPPPDVTSWAEDLAAVRALIDYSTSNADLVATIEATAPAPGGYETVSNRAMGAIQAETDPTVPAWAKAETPPASGLTTNDVQSVVTNETGVGDWAFPIYLNSPYAPSLEWIEENGNRGTVYYVVEGPTHDSFGWSMWVMFYEFGYVEPDAWGMQDSLELTSDEPETSSTITLSDYGDYPITISRGKVNALGLARLVDLPPLTNSIPDAAARAVYDVHDLMWDESESILYWHKIRQGHDEYIAVTNIDLTHPTNAVILKAWREANQ